MLRDMSGGDHSGSYRVTATIDVDNIPLPGFLSYLSLGFKVISTMIIVLMASWVIITIRTTRRLHKTHNIFVAHLMFIDIVFAVTSTLLSGAMMIGYFTGVGDFIGCNVYVFMLYPTGVVFFTFLMMSTDKVIALTLPLRHRTIMKPRVVCGVIIVQHILAVIIYAQNLFASGGFTKIAQFGTCIRNDSALLENLITVTIPMLLTCLITITLDVYLTIKAYQIRKKIQEESKLSGGHNRDNDSLKALKKKEANIKKNLKPVITLLVVVMGNSFFGLLFGILFVPAVLLDSPTVYESVVRYLISPNIGYITFLIHPLAYGLYFKQIREPMMRLLKGITCPCKCKSAAVAPEPNRNRITWLNPN